MAKALVLLLAAAAAVLPSALGMHGRAGIPDGAERLRRAAEMGQTDEVKRLVLKDKVEVDSTPMFGEAPLHWASQSGHLGTVEELINLGGDVRSTAARESPVSRAAYRRNTHAAAAAAAAAPPLGHERADAACRATRIVLTGQHPLLSAWRR